ncbi:MAG: carboxypeptidase regulatory-like domain-containing protein [Acidobacteria bacterium]|nr:carboxypeptidase regulatory-like domain-containing protein [Acidobacteriota bacterium]
MSIKNIVLLCKCIIISILFLSHFQELQQVKAQSAGSTTSTITGKAIDEQMSVLGGVTVIAKNPQTNFLREVVTQEDGSYVISQLPPGNYVVTVTNSGFTSQMRPVELVLGTTTVLNFTLKIGTPTEIIEIIAGDDVFLEGKPESSTNINRNTITTLPINRRNFLDFSITAARVLADRVPAQGASATSGLSFNGQSARFNNITIDGLDNNDLGSGSVRSTFSQEAVQEFQIISDGYNAEFGRALGGIVNIITRGGSNEFHSQLFVLNRNDDIAARDAFAPVKPPYSQYQFGGALEGPIKRDKAFFFTSFERLTLKQNNIVTITNETIKSINQLGFNVRNGAIPFSLNNSVFLARVDGKVSDSDTFWVRYNFGGSYNGALEPFGGLVAENNGGIQRLTDNSLALNNTYISSPLNLINETRFLFTRRNQKINPIDSAPQVRILAPEGMITLGQSTFLPQPRVFNIFQIINNTALIRGRQQIKLGVDFQRFSTVGRETQLPIFLGGGAFFTDIDFSQIAQMTGLPKLNSLQAFDPNLRTPVQKAFLSALSGVAPILFPGFPSNVPLADLPLPAFYTQGFGDPSLSTIGKEFSFYVQDDIKLRSNLIIKAGLRYDLIRLKFVPKNNGNFAPRLAFSYSPSKLAKLNIHGAYGLFFAGALVGQAFAIQTINSGRFNVPTLPFPFSVIPFSLPGRKFPQTTSLPPGIEVIPQFAQGSSFSPELKNSYSQQTTFGINYLVNSTTAIALDYAFIRGVKIFGQRDINPIVRPTNNPIDSALNGRIDPTKGTILQFETSFDSYYHALTLSFSRRFTSNLGFLAHYTFSKAIDNTSDFRPDLAETVDPLNIGAERGLSLQDVRSRLVLSSTWEPTFKNPLVKGFQFSTIISLNTGRPYNLVAGTDLNGNGDLPNGDRPLVGGVSIGRNTGITPGFANVDLRALRKVKFNERYEIQGLVEVFNLFNRTNINELNRVFPPDAQGNFSLPAKDGGRFTITPDRFRSAFSSRQLQLGVRLSF